MKNVKYLKCIKCGKIYDPVPGRYTCDDCGGIEGILDVVYDYDYISKICNKEYFLNTNNYSMWRYEPFLPIKKKGLKPKLRVGWSPLYKTDRLAEEIGLKRLYIKDEGINPTASLKDRASAIAVAKALEENNRIICCSSTGNAASSLAGNAASSGIKTVIFVPQRAPQGKIAQLKIFGSNVISVKGTYNEAFELSKIAIEKYGWYNRNAAINPYLMEGKKTVTFEICEQLNWEVPDWAVVSVGDGCTIAGIWKGFLDLYNTGLINKLPKLVGVQAEGCSPLTEAFYSNTKFKPTKENTIADSIAVGVPRNAEKALRAVRESKGTFINVTDDEILSSMRLLGSKAGIFGEPAGVAGFAGLKKLVNKKIIDYNEMVVCIVTGNGLKDTNNAIKASGYPIEVEPDEKKLFNVLENIEGLL